MGAHLGQRHQGRTGRDCDFAVPKPANAWTMDKLAKWFPEMPAESKEKKESNGYLRLIQPISAGKDRVKVSLDFMEGAVVDRSGERIRVDESFQ